jgi:hypothetical protein
VQFVEAHHFHVGRHSKFEVHSGENSSQHLDSLFLGAEKILKFHRSACKIGWSKHPRAFVEVVEGSVTSKFGIQASV